MRQIQSMSLAQKTMKRWSRAPCLSNGRTNQVTTSNTAVTRTHTGSFNKSGRVVLSQPQGVWTSLNTDWLCPVTKESSPPGGHIKVPDRHPRPRHSGNDTQAALEKRLCIRRISITLVQSLAIR